MYAPCVLNMWAKAGKRTCACSREEYGCSGMHAWACSGLHMSHAVHAGPSGAALDEAAAEEPKLLAFTGTGRRLDGKPAAGGPPVAVKSDIGIRRPPPPQVPSGFRKTLIQEHAEMMQSSPVSMHANACMHVSCHGVRIKG